MRNVCLFTVVTASQVDDEYHHTQLLQTKIKHPTKSQDPKVYVSKMMKELKQHVHGLKNGSNLSSGYTYSYGNNSSSSGYNSSSSEMDELLKQHAHGHKDSHLSSGYDDSYYSSSSEMDEFEQQIEACAMGCIFPDGFPTESTSWQAQPVCWDGPSCLENDGFMGCFEGCLGDEHPIVEGIKECKDNYPGKVMMCMECGVYCMDETECDPYSCGENADFLGCHPECMLHHPGNDDQAVHAGEDARPGGSDLMQVKVKHPKVYVSKMMKELKQHAHGLKNGSNLSSGYTYSYGNNSSSSGYNSSSSEMDELLKQHAHGLKKDSHSSSGYDDSYYSSSSEMDEFEQQIEACAMGCIFPDGFPTESTSWQAQPVCWDGPSCLENDGFMGCFEGCLGDEHPIVEGINECKDNYPGKVMMCMECGVYCMDETECDPYSCGENADFLGCHPECMLHHPGNDEQAVAHAEEDGHRGPDGTDLMQVKQHLKRISNK